MSDQDELKQLYKDAIEKIYSEKDLSLAKNSWNDFYSSKLHAESAGQIYDSASFLSAVLGMKKGFVKVEVKLEQLTRMGRKVGACESLRLEKEDGDVMTAKAIILVEFGEIGSEDEKKVIDLREAVEFGQA